MTNSIDARGYTNIILVMNMRRFVKVEDQKRFESFRTSPAFLEVLRTQWPEKLKDSRAFTTVKHDVDENIPDVRMSTDEVCFATGIFRLHTLEEYVTPTYYLSDKEQVSFPDEIKDNLQFKNLFLEVWKRWDIYIRPTVTGMFTVRLKRCYEKATSLLNIASDVVALQTAFDIPSAMQRLELLRENLADGNISQQSKQKSIETFLEWAGKGKGSQGQPNYVPIQWKLVTEVCRKFIQDIDMTIPLEYPPITLQEPEPIAPTPLHDSYVVYHINELFAPVQLTKKVRPRSGAEEADMEQSDTKQVQTKVLVNPEDIYKSEELKHNLVGLIEGAILQKSHRKAQTSYFPRHYSEYTDNVFAKNRATWNDEICLLTPRAAVIIPSHKAMQDELFISNFWAATSRVKYTWYWDAMVRMLEFVVEIRVLAQLMERSSVNTLQEFEHEIATIRSHMVRRDIRINYRTLSEKVDKVASLSRMLSVGQNLSTPSVWSRAEFAVEKARLLLSQQDVPLLIEHTERNVNNMNNLLDHIDELHLAHLSESNNKWAYSLSFLLAGLSLSFVIFAVVQFWASVEQLSIGTLTSIERNLIPLIAKSGSILAAFLVLVSFVVILMLTVSFTKHLVEFFRQRGKLR
jgi:hypothetical protein